MLKAKSVVPNKFWILEGSDGDRKGTLSVQGDSVRVVLDNNVTVYEDINKACWDLGLSLPAREEKTKETTEEVMGYPTRCEAYNPTWDIKRKIPVFTKTAKSKTLHAAGYYVVHFENGWVQSFCPKVSTLDVNEYQGPFKDKLEMRERLRKLHASDVN